MRSSLAIPWINENGLPVNLWDRRAMSLRRVWVVIARVSCRLLLGALGAQGNR
jgi:hypothetical protein